MRLYSQGLLQSRPSSRRYSCVDFLCVDFLFLCIVDCWNLVRDFHFCCDFCWLAIAICEESLEGVEIEYLEVEPLPMLNTDLETPPDGFPAVVEDFRRQIREADCILFASPEYNYSIAGLVSSPSRNLLMARWIFIFIF